MSTPVTGVNELVLEVEDLEAAERFYAGALGLPVVERWPEREAIWLMAGDRTRIGLWRPQVGVAGGRGGAHVHFALHLADADFDAAVDRLRTAGLDPQTETRRRLRRVSSRSAYADDPDGNCVELWTQDVREYLGRAEPPAQLPTEASAPAYFDKQAVSWVDEYDRPVVRGHWWRTRARTAADLIGEGGGRDLLEVGVGGGRMLELLAAAGWNVSGVDASPRMVELARERLPTFAGQLEVAHAERLPYEDASFDAAVSVGTLEYTDMQASLREIARVVRPGGPVVIGLRNGLAPTFAWQRTVVHPIANAVKRVVAVGRPAPRPRRAPLSRRRAIGVLDAAGLAVKTDRLVACAVIPDPLDHLLPGLAHRAAAYAERSRMLRQVLGTQRLVLATRR